MPNRPLYRDNPRPCYSGYVEPKLEKNWTTQGGSKTLADGANKKYCEKCVFGTGYHALFCTGLTFPVHCTKYTTAMIINCIRCKLPVSVPISEKELKEWHESDTPKLIQHQFPHVPAELREMVLSGICPTCWDRLFLEMQDEDDDPEEEL